MHQWLEYKGLEVPNPGLSYATELRLKQDLQRLVDWNPKSNWEAGSDPTVDDDNSWDFFAGSQWLNNATQALFVCIDNSTGAAIWKEIATGSVGGNLSITIKTSNYTAAPGDLVICNVTGGSFTVSLPAITANARIGIKLGTASGSSTVTISPNGLDEIDDQVSVVLYAKNDYLELQGDATNGQWVVIEDGLQPHKAKMRNTSTQSIPNASTTTITFNSTDYDNVALCNLSNETMTIRRSGVHGMTSYFRISTTLTTGQRAQLLMRVNGTSVAESLSYVSANSVTVVCQNNWQGFLSAGDVITWAAAHTHGSAVNIGGSTVETYGALCELR